MEETLGNMTLYDAKKYFRQAQNAVFNYTEMEAKVREATNNEPWGASSTLMEQVAQGTYSLRERDEVLAMLLRRFTEKTGSEWRQVYKALQLLDFCVRRSSEKFVDDARTVLLVVLQQQLEHFHYVDSQARDQGVNVRTRAAALAQLLQDDQALRRERRKARETAAKYRGSSSAAATATGSGLATAMNPRAGFSKSTAHGISVSADFDSDDDTGSGPAEAKNQHVERFTFSDEAPEPQPQQQQQDLLHEECEEEDDDEEFAEFQTAVPVKADVLFSATTTSSSSTAAGAAAQPKEVVPAILSEANHKTADPFGSLFTSAKAGGAGTSGSTTANTSGSTTGSTSGTTTGSTTASTTARAQPSEEVDLLSF